jgi:hypothetical protein
MKFWVVTKQFWYGESMNPNTSHAVVYTVRDTLWIRGQVVWCVYAAWGVAVNQLMVLRMMFDLVKGKYLMQSVTGPVYCLVSSA